MKTKKPEIVAYMRPAYGEVISQEEYARWEHEASKNPGTPYGEWRKNETIEYSEPLIRLSDYERLQAECAHYKNAIAEITTRHSVDRWANTSSDKELEQYLSDGIAQLEGEYRKQIEALQAECKKLVEAFDAGRRAAQTEVHILREWIKETADQYDICTRNVLREVCDGCRCRHRKQGGEP